MLRLEHLLVLAVVLCCLLALLVLLLQEKCDEGFVGLDALLTARGKHRYRLLLQQEQQQCPQQLLFLVTGMQCCTEVDSLTSSRYNDISKCCSSLAEVVFAAAAAR